MIGLRKVLESQVTLSKLFDSHLPEYYKFDGNNEFIYNIAPRYLIPGATVYDIGGGKNPLIKVKIKEEFCLRVIGLDIDQGELQGAPPSSYDEIICADICKYDGRGDGDLIICQALLEHVPDVASAFKAFASILKPGGKAIIFVPCRNALFARLNLILPEAIKRRILFVIYPETKYSQGFRSYYNRCTPKDFNDLAAQYGFELEDMEVYYKSSYFSFCFPLYAVWRLWVILFRFLRGAQAAETFSMVIRKI